MLSYRFIVKGSKGTPYIATFDFSENFGKAQLYIPVDEGIRE